MTPLLQLALDMLDEDRALLTSDMCAPYVDILEAGTPLIKSVGIGIVSKLNQAHPAHIIVADLKSSDVGAYEAEMAFTAGADIVTTLGLTTTATIIEVQKQADKWKRRALVDLTGVLDPISRTKELKNHGVSMILYHRSIDEEVTEGAVWNEQSASLVNELCNLGMDVLVAGGINLDVLPLLRNMNLFGIVVGRAITAQTNQTAAAQMIKQKCQEIWP